MPYLSDETDMYEQNFSDIPLTRALGYLKPGDHLCFIYKTSEEQILVADPFLHKGLAKGEKLLLLMKHLTFKEIQANFVTGGVDALQLPEANQLDIFDSVQAFLKNGRFDPEKTLTLLQEAADLALKEGYTGLRIIIDMAQVLAALPRKEHLIEYESRLNDFLHNSPITAICQYHENHFAPEVLLDILDTHPLVIVNGHIHHNLHYALSAEILKEKQDKQMQVEEKQHLSEKKFADLFEHMLDGFAYHEIVLNDTGEPIDYRFLQVNPSFEAFIGLKQSEIVGRCVTEISPSIRQHDFDWIGIYGQVALTGKGIHFESYSQPLDKWYRVTAYSPHQNHFATIFVDITEYKRTETDLQRIKRDYKVINACNEVLARTIDETELLQMVCEIFIKVRGYRMAWIDLTEDDKEKTMHPVVRVGYDDGYLDIMHMTWTDTEFGREPTGIAIRTKEPHIITNMLTNPNHTLWRDEAINRGYASSIALPLITDHQVLGALNIYAAEPDAFDDEEVNLLMTLADNLAYGIVISRMHDKRAQAETALQKRQKNLATAQAITHIGSWEWNREEDFIYWSDEIYQILGFTIELPPSLDLIIGLLDPDSGDTYGQEISSFFTGQGNSSIEFRIIRSDGTTRILHAQSKIVHDEQAAHSYVLGTIQDVTESREAEENLRKLTQVIEQGSAVIMITDVNGRIEYVNLRFTQLTGYTADEIIGKNPRILKSGYMSPVEYKNLWETITNGSKWQGDFLNKKKNGDLFWERASISPIMDGNDKITHFLAIKEDITTQKRDQENLLWEVSVNASLAELAKAIMKNSSLEAISRLILEKAQQLTHSIFGYVGYIDAQTNHLIIPALTHEIWDVYQVPNKSQIFIEQGHNTGLFGWVLDHKKPLLTNTPSTDARSMGTSSDYIPIDRFISTPALYDNNLIGQVALANAPHDYTERDLDLMQRLANLYAISVNNHQAGKVIQRKNRDLQLLYQASQALSSTLNQEELFTILLDQIRGLLNVFACSVWLIDEDTGELVCRQATEPQRGVISGWRLDEGQGLAGWVINHGKSLIVNDATKDERHFKEIDNKTGLELHSILTVPVQTTKKLLGVLQVVDETKNRFDHEDQSLMESLANVAANTLTNSHLHATLEMAQEQLIQKERLAILGQMSATVAHEIRNPLMSVRMGLDYMLDDVKESDPRWQGASLMRVSISRIEHIVKTLLFIARTPELNKVPTNLKLLIESEVALWQQTLTIQQISCHLQLADDLSPCIVDANQIARVLSNLLNNSINALPPYGEIWITLQTNANMEQIITISDNGPGIPSEIQGMLFEPFFTTRAQGTGLGLFIVRKIIEDHNGQVKVWSEINQRTQFTITLPA